jgi:hypothetical protein
MELTANLSGLPPAVAQRVIRTLAHEDAAQFALGRVRQARMKRFYDAVIRPGFNTELGPMTANIDENQAIQCRRKYGQLCFADPEFLPWLLKQPDGEGFGVSIVGTRVQSGFTGRGDSRGSGVEDRGLKVARG